MNVELVPVEQVRFIWPIVSPWIRRSIERVDLSHYGAVEAQIVAGVARLWVVHNGVISAAVITEVHFVEGGKVCTIIACGGGGVLSTLGLLSQIEEYAKQEGCRSVIVWGRKGWARALHDYREAAIVLRKELE